MTPSRFLPAVLRAARSLLKSKHSERKVALHLGVSVSGLRDALKRPRKVGKGNAGRPRKVTAAQRLAIVRRLAKESRQGRRPTAAYLKRVLRLIGVSVDTVRREMKRAGKCWISRVTKPQFTDSARKYRVKFCKRVLKSRSYRKVKCWIDQWVVPIPLEHTVPRDNYFWGDKSERHQPWAVKANRKYKAPCAKLLAGICGEPAKVMFCVSYTGKRLTKVLAADIYKKHLVPALRRTFPGETKFQVQQDGDKSLNASEVCSAMHECGVSFWERNKGGEAPPADSGDLWPVENVWAWSTKKLIRKVSRSKKWSKGVAGGKVVKASDLKAWTGFCQSIVRSTRRTSIGKLIGGMRRRFVSCVAAGGGPIKK